MDDDLDKPEDIRHRWDQKILAAKKSAGLYDLNFEEQELTDEEEPDDDEHAFMKTWKKAEAEDPDEEEDDDDEEELLVEGMDEKEVQEHIKELISELEKPEIDDYVAVLPIEFEFKLAVKARKGLSTQFGHI